MTVFFAADNHFGHGMIIKYCNRPYGQAAKDYLAQRADNPNAKNDPEYKRLLKLSITEMDEDMVLRWNSVVKPDDTVYHLGDLAFRNCQDVFYRLNGVKHLIIGNHDDRKTLTLPWASEPKHYDEIKVEDAEGISRTLILCHYPIEEWDGYFRGTIHLHGHVHGKQMKPCDKVRVDVGVDCFNFYPVTIDQILASVSNE
jgi:calcineurin-like phosphoesterase family protein